MTHLYLYTSKETERDWEGVPSEYERPASAIVLDDSRDVLVTEFGKAQLPGRYLLPHEFSPQQLFARVAAAYSDDVAHAQRLYDYISKLWFMPATPVLSNGGTGKGLPISCYLNAVPDSIDGIVGVWNENVYLASRGGGIGTYWGYVREIGHEVGGVGKTSGIIPFVHVQDSLTLAISQGSQRRGAGAVYLDVGHPEIEEFLEVRKPTGDFNRKSLNLHHGVLIPDAFMDAMREDGPWDLVSPRTGKAVRTVGARELFQKLVETRLQTGEPYLVFIDTINRAQPKHHRELGLKVTTSNLCAEITLPTGEDHMGRDRTAVCCLSSVNLETWDEWKDHPTFIEDVMRFLDNVLQDFIDRAPDQMAKAKYAAARERSVGLGAMGLHGYLQSKGIAFESALAKSFNRRTFKYLRHQVERASVALAHEKGACDDWLEWNMFQAPGEKDKDPQRFSHKMAIAPTASISIIAGEASPGIDPIPNNVYVQKTMSGSFTVRNKHLDRVLRSKCTHGSTIEDKWLDEVWDSILEHGGSVQHLDILSEHERTVFKTSMEIDQRWILELAADRAESVDQSQSLNLFIPADVDKWDLLMLHYDAWRRGIKSLYYLRSRSVQRAGHAGGVEADNTTEAPTVHVAPTTDYEECLACQ